MLIWLAAALAGSALAYAQYRPGGLSRTTLLPGLRATALALAFALLGDAPIGRSHPLPPYAALDASASWLTSGDSALWNRAVRTTDSVGADTTLLLGDSVRAQRANGLPADVTTRVAPLVERALGAGRSVVLVTDGRLDDPERLVELPAGSRVVTLEGAARPDAAVVGFDGPGAVVAGDSADFSVVLGSGAAGAPAGKLEVRLGDTSIAVAAVEALESYAERELRVRAEIAGTAGPRVLRAVITVPGDAIALNDTLSAIIDVARGASAVFVSTAPDFDARFALDVLRGTLAVPTRGYFRVAPGQWRVDGALTAVGEDEVRRALAEAPLAVIHGDTAIFGAPRALTRGSLALLAPPAQKGDDYYPTGAPPSPLSASLAGLPWDSLPPVELGDAGRDAEWIALTARRARRFDERALVSGSARPRRTIVLPATGLWRWRFRGGRGADAFTAVWGSVFDWLTGDVRDERAAHPAASWVRSGEPIRWRRGRAADTAATVMLRLRGASAVDTITLRFAGEGGMATSPPLRSGIYETRSAGGDGLLAVDVSSEWVPRRATVRAGAVGGASPAGSAPRARTEWWLYALAIAALCAEWILRRRFGLR